MVATRVRLSAGTLCLPLRDSSSFQIRRDEVKVSHTMSNTGAISREELIIRQAQDRPPAERATFIDGACLGDAALRQRIEARLNANAQSATLLPTQIEADQPAVKRDFVDHRPDEAEGQTLGRYKLIEKLGEGGFGAVWLAEQREPVRRKVAFKIIKLGMDTKQVVARFESTWRAAPESPCARSPAWPADIPPAGTAA